MSKVVMTIEDLPGNRIKVTCNPQVGTLIKKQASGHGLTSAEGLLIFVANKVIEQQKQSGSIIVPIPRLGRP